MEAKERFNEIRKKPVAEWKAEIEKLSDEVQFYGRPINWTVKEVVRGWLVIEYKRLKAWPDWRNRLCIRQVKS